MASFVGREIQFYLRLISVFIGVLLTAKWYRANYPDHKHIFLIIIIALVLGLYVNKV